MRSLRSTFRQATHCRTLCCSWPRSTRLRAKLERSATDFQPIVRLNRDTGQRELVLMRWGLILFWAKEPSIGLRTSCPSQSDGVRWRKTWLYLRRSCQKVTESPNASLPVNSLRTAAPAALGAVSGNEFWKRGRRKRTQLIWNPESAIHCYSSLARATPGLNLLPLKEIQRPGSSETLNMAYPLSRFLRLLNLTNSVLRFPPSA